MVIDFMRKTALTFLCVLSILLFSFSHLSIVTNSDSSSFLKYMVDDVFVGTLKQTITIHNPSLSRIADGNLYVPIVRNETARHYVILHNLSSSTGQATFRSDVSGNVYAVWNNIAINSKQTFTARLDYYVFSFSTGYTINSSLIGDYNTSSYFYTKYTQPEEYIESENQQIISEEENLISNATSISEKISNIYNFVVKHIHYAEQTDERGALWALENGKGDCSEYSYLFVALCRAAGIPARIQAGFAFHSISESLENGHMWAEYYLENYGWIPVDATWKMFNEMDYWHFSSMQSVPEITPYANYVFNNTIGAKPEDTQNVALQQTSLNVFADAPFMEDLFQTVQKIEQAKLTLFLAKIVGTTLLFSEEVKKAEQMLLESRINLQNAINFLENQPLIAQSNATSAFNSAQEALGSMWMSIVKMFTLVIGVLLTLLVAVLVLAKRSHSFRRFSFFS